MTLLIISLSVAFILLMGGMWIGAALGLGGVMAAVSLLGSKALFLIGMRTYSAMTNYILVAVPLFIFMGEILEMSRATQKLYDGLSKIVQGLPGGLLQTNIIACTVFAALSGSSVAEAATMGRVSYRRLVERGYPPQMITGSIAAGGTLGILIPPSVIMIVYGAWAEQSVGRLFIAGIVPGLMLSAMFSIYVLIAGHRFREHSPVSGQGFLRDIRERSSGLVEIWPFLLIICLVIGSIYLGIATATEVAAVGVAAVLLTTVVMRLMTWRILWGSCLNTVKSTSSLFFIVIGAYAMSEAITMYGFAPLLSKLASSFGSPTMVLIGVCVLYVVLGCFLDAFGMMLLTLPFLLPVLKALGIDLVWFGIILVILIELGLITPPVGINLFVVQGVTGVSFATVTRGSAPYVVVMVIAIALVIIFPQIALWLPSRMGP